jgi:hypothetical protein
MSLFYGGNPSNSSETSLIRACFDAKNGSSLGTQTKSHVMLTPQGFQRVHDYLLQDQSSFFFPKNVSESADVIVLIKLKRTVMYNEVREKAHYGNVQICGSIWSCPVCAKQITQQRRAELKKGIDCWKTDFNGSVYLLTLTFSHSPDQSLKSNLEGLKKQ